MYRADSEGRAGFTLIEACVALIASGVLLVGLVRFFKDFNRSFRAQEQMAERDLNAHYANNRLAEALMAAGANLPVRGWDFIAFPDGNPGGRIRIGVNPRGGMQFLAVDASDASEIEVDDGKGFARAKSLLAFPQDPGRPPFQVDIDLGYNANGFVNGFKAQGSGSLIRLSVPLTLAAGDAVYAYAVEEYRLQNGNLMLDEMVLAENIEKIRFSGLAADQTPTGKWASMRSAKLEITARTPHPDSAMAKSGGYPSLALSMDVLLRNRL